MHNVSDVTKIVFIMPENGKMIKLSSRVNKGRAKKFSTVSKTKSGSVIIQFQRILLKL